MKIINITNKGVRPSKVDVVVSFNKSPKTFTLEPGQFIYVQGDVKSLLTQAMRVQKQRGLIDFTDESEVLHDTIVETNQVEEVAVSNLSEEPILEENINIDIFDMSLEEVQKTEEVKETPKRGKGRPKGSYKLSSKRKEAVEKKSQDNDK